MEEPSLKFEEVVYRALERCEDDRAPCLECLSKVAAEMILDWLEARSMIEIESWPLEDEISV